MKIFEWICFNIFESYIYIYERLFVWTLKPNTKGFDEIANHWFIYWYQQMQIWTSYNQIFWIHCESWTKYKYEFQKNWHYSWMKDFNVDQKNKIYFEIHQLLSTIYIKLFWFNDVTD